MTSGSRLRSSDSNRIRFNGSFPVRLLESDQVVFSNGRSRCSTAKNAQKCLSCIGLACCQPSRPPSHRYYTVGIKTDRQCSRNSVHFKIPFTNNTSLRVFAHARQEIGRHGCRAHETARSRRKLSLFAGRSLQANK